MTTTLSMNAQATLDEIIAALTWADAVKVCKNAADLSFSRSLPLSEAAWQRAEDACNLARQSDIEFVGDLAKDACQSAAVIQTLEERSR